jgi:hypothetical protein
VHRVCAARTNPAKLEGSKLISELERKLLRPLLLISYDTNAVSIEVIIPCPKQRKPVCAVRWHTLVSCTPQYTLLTLHSPCETFSHDAYTQMGQGGNTE